MPAQGGSLNRHREQYDVVIAGGGVIGLACAWRAARGGRRVCVLERDQLAAGASGVAAGMLAPVGEATWGEEPLLKLGLASLEAWPGFAAELELDSGRPAGLERVGALHLALDGDEAEELRRRYRLHIDLELKSEWLKPSGCRELEPAIAPGVRGGLYAPDEASVDPVVLCDALAAAIQRHNGLIETGAEITGLSLGDDAVSVRLADGREVTGSQLVVATGAWSGSADWLPAELRPAVRPVKGQLLVLRGEEPVCERIVSGERVYLVPREDGRLIVGATVEEQGFDTTVTAGAVHELLREAYRVLPEVAELELLQARAGLRPGTPDNAPVIERAADRVILATGHYRNGVLLAPTTAASVSQLLGEPEQDRLLRTAPGGEGAVAR
jgi:glycine oxidase